MNLCPPRVAASVLVLLVLLIGLKAIAIVTAVPEPPLPPLLQGLPSVSGYTTVCPPATEQEAASRHRFGYDRELIAWTPELGRRLEREFPPGSNAKHLAERLQELGFVTIGPCRGDSTVRAAMFRQHGGFLFRPGGLSMTATIWWKVDDADRLIWAKGMVFYDGL